MVGSPLYKYIGVYIYIGINKYNAPPRPSTDHSSHPCPPYTAIGTRMLKEKSSTGYCKLDDWVCYIPDGRRVVLYIPYRITS